MLDDYLDKLGDIQHRIRMSEVFQWIEKNYPTLVGVIKWNQAMFTDHGTFIIGFSVAKNHMSFTPEEEVVSIFSEEIRKAGYEHTKGLIKIKWTQEIDYELIRTMINFNIKEKAACTTFFRK